MTRDRIVTVVACCVAVAAVTGAVAVNAVDSSRIAGKDRAVQAARAETRAADAKAAKPITVTKVVQNPIFGKSVLLGIHAAGQITSGGVYDNASTTPDTTPDDQTCSTEYADDASASNITIDRQQYMNACENNVYATARQDPGK
ncbi:hypothetical protein NGB36_28155 [Streptomyces sp. RB6PN25]|uniref:Secreted protein n=1 Tax=Streptomyces humicola TaxID=2953240 RepID=A0ABT1Q6A1_9ACTN|nr:hypothetical protein [Streptomyces humicola]MCQ4084350.1 hypothetical protein [Streptomyces humicola]